MKIPMVPKVSSKNKGFATIIVILVVVLTLAFLGYKYFSSKRPKTSGGQSIGLIERRSKPTGIISGVSLARATDSEGAPLDLADGFGVKDPKIFVASALNNAPVGTEIAYVRYFDGNYLDHKSIKIAKANSKYAYFEWSLKSPLEVRRPGKYLIKLYANGVLERAVEFRVS